VIAVGAKLELVALPGLPVIWPGDDLGAILRAGLDRAELGTRPGDVLVVASKLVSRAEGRFVDLAQVDASERARELAGVTGHDPRHVELILRESAAVSRAARGVLVVRHRLGFVVANAGIDRSNVGDGRLLLLPVDPDRSAARLREALGVDGVVISDSFGRPFRLGTVGAAIGVAGVPALFDQRGRRDLFGRRLDQTVTALADQVAAAADLVAGQADEGRGAVLVRGLRFDPAGDGAGALLRSPGEDLYCDLAPGAPVVLASPAPAHPPLADGSRAGSVEP
jgi:coenzyme F420-0:L-glutamate ligase/coenzyme F420-1:gamma-L-glutamate ligase